MNQQELEYSLIQLTKKTTATEISSSESSLLADHFLNHRWNSIIKHPKLKNYFSLNQKHQLSLKSLSPAAVEEEKGEEEQLIKLVFIATLLSVYVQINFTGPTQFEYQPISILSNEEEELEEVELNSISLDLLSLAGEPAYHLAKSATYLLMAIQLIETLSEENRLQTTVWWKLRAEMLRRQLFDQPIPLPDQLIKQIDQLSEDLFLSSNDDNDLLPMLTLERGLAEHRIGNEKAANLLFRKAVTQAKLEYELTGIPGKRTKFQEKEISQLVVLAKSRTRQITTDCPLTAAEEELPTPVTKDTMPVTLALDDDTLMEKTQFTQSTKTSLKLDPSNQPNLYPLDQALLLALSLSIKNTSPAHGLTNSQMSPFIERVLENPNNWSIHSMGLLIRSRLEAHRTRTVERGLLQLQALVDQLTKDAENDPIDKSTAFERVRWTWSLALPSKWELEKELAQKFLGLGITRSALEIFERLEMWELVVQCHLNLDSHKIGIDLVNDLINGNKIESSLKMSTRYRSSNYQQDPKRLGKLWCLLAELESEPSHFETAWKVSGYTSSRSQRSLGRHYFMKGDHVKSKECLKRALKINPLFNKTWFIYGCASMRTDDWDQAELAFRRCVGLDDEDAEAWNNLATVHLKKASMIDESNPENKHSNQPQLKSQTFDSHQENFDNEDNQDALNETNDSEEDQERSSLSEGKFSRPMAAFYALQQAVKLSYDSWRMYTNYMIISMSVGEYIEATRALGRIIEIRGIDGIDIEVVSKLIKVIKTQRQSNLNLDLKQEQDEKSRRQNRLFERLRDVFDRIILVKNPIDPIIWEFRSELAQIGNDLEGVLKFQIDAYRIGVLSNPDLWISNLNEWLKAVDLLNRTIDKLCTIGPQLSSLNSSVGDSEGHVKLKSNFGNWKWQAKNLSSNFLAKSKSSFEDHPSFILLSDSLKSLSSSSS
ncbi:hypothetical protein MJO29_003323 [Puccinia striiformis f. sp. tritici]|uniref:Uncharacterized protein n=1 Tax=Puccinia striiformis f. sp. tritici PST-78 TaxID=1165861 RepID=A0A0L0VF88_9BASI|nr:hypothetical protein Pst134EB_005915 [Puccinia striiformis f. sp. tritici]KAI7965225.1 hypothetical protein MJO29_003323 [Puccinia striiformis f. sp. tritici]KNE97928.1 hypothetical protein PSTG_08801 [Puccinia striiformis f. sp. tritici PST-78]